jgi:hypothetical protein
MGLPCSPFLQGGDLGQGDKRGIVQLLGKKRQAVRIRKSLQVGKNVQDPVTSHVETHFQMVNEWLIQP